MQHRTSISACVSLEQSSFTPSGVTRNDTVDTYETLDTFSAKIRPLWKVQNAPRQSIVSQSINPLELNHPLQRKTASNPCHIRLAGAPKCVLGQKRYLPEVVKVITAFLSEVEVHAAAIHKIGSRSIVVLKHTCMRMHETAPQQGRSRTSQPH